MFRAIFGCQVVSASNSAEAVSTPDLAKIPLPIESSKDEFIMMSSLDSTNSTDALEVVDASISCDMLPEQHQKSLAMIVRLNPIPTANDVLVSKGWLKGAILNLFCQSHAGL